MQAYSISSWKKQNKTKHTANAGAQLSGIQYGAISHRPKEPTPGREEDEYTGEISKAISSQFAALPPGEIAKVFANMFRLMNLDKLRHMRERDDAYLYRGMSSQDAQYYQG